MSLVKKTGKGRYKYTDTFEDVEGTIEVKTETVVGADGAEGRSRITEVLVDVSDSDARGPSFEKAGSPPDTLLRLRAEDFAILARVHGAIVDIKRHLEG